MARADPPAVVPTGGAPLVASWRDFFVFQSPDGDHRLRVGGLVQGDGRFFPANTAPGPVDQFLLRSARFEFDATFARYIDARLNFDGGQGKFQLQEAWTELHLHHAFRLRVGKVKVPFGLERLQYEGRTAFMERAFPTQIAPNRDTGVEILGDVGDGALEYAVGVFNGVVDNSTTDGELDNDKEIAGRVFVRPFAAVGPRALRNLGVGGAGSFAQLTGQLSGRTVVNPQLLTLQTDGLTTFFKYNTDAASSVDGTAIAAGPRVRATANGYYYWWRLGAMGEWAWNAIDVRLGPHRDTVGTTAWQGYVTFLLTDDEASFAGVKPRTPFDLRAGWHSLGALEIALRASGVAVDDIAFAQFADTKTSYADPKKSARAATSYAAGVNWYLNANAKLQLDFVRTDFTGGAATGDRPSEIALMTRLQFAL